ncbi:ArnT family glycosyltransferase [Xanthomonas melonis]|uniref:Dolichyl-phosphate-mannose--protein mannosyltransferase n=1 Tax=Xanthomonas melonis TaxID=56456 RepID=A0A2S7DMQ4_9XANT|nr:glycosyltransferase family 39 protein [Xanthomonas melonis]MCC4601129.1 glycosyltransferase family 39 protein [Xanthomonas melonis]PPU75047.1 dolichyl-phosphate-mannose--protein mannosyltransferase [Xanthomonas melonis]
MLKTRASKDFWLLAVTAVLVIGAGLGLRDPWPSDEPRFALVAKQMVLSGDWLFPHRGNELYSDKPPMLMWLQALFYTLLGNWRVAFLLPSLLAALGTLACVYDLGRRLWTRRVGAYAAWMLLFTLHFTFQAKKAQIDPLVVFWITLANYGLLRHLLLGPAWRWWTLGWFAAGLGVITKGVGIIALLMLIPAGIAAVRGWPGVRVHVRDRRFWLGPLFFFVAIALWFVPMVVTALTAGQPEYRVYLNDILLRQTAKRYASSWDHAQPVWYHLQSMATMWLPPILLLPWAIPAWRRRLRRRDARYLLPLAWWLLVLVFFTIPSGKRDVYILPALPMFCLALAPLAAGLLRRAGVQRLLFGFALLLSVAFVAGGAAMLIGHPGFEQKIMDSRGVGSEATDPLGWLLLAVGGWGAVCLLVLRVRRSVLAVAALLGAWWVSFGLVCYPIFNDSSSAGAVMREAGRRIGPEAQLGLVAWKEQNLLMADRPAQTFGFKVPWDLQLRDGVAWQAADPKRRWLMVQETALLDCVDRRRSQLVGVANRRRWWLVPADAIQGACVASATQKAVEAREQGNLDAE